MGLLEFDEMPSQSDFEDLVERANALVVEARESRVAALADEKDGAPSASLKRPYTDYWTPAPRFHLGAKKPRVYEVLVNSNLHVNNITGGSSGANASDWAPYGRLPAGGVCGSCRAYNSSTNDICWQCGFTLMGPDALEFRVPPGSPCPLPSTLWRKPADYPREADANSDKNTFRDVRTLRLLYDRQGQRFIAFQQAVSQCEHHTLADWPIPGPSTVMWVLKWIVARGGTPLAWHAAWKNNGRLQDSEAAVLHHESRILETSLCYDQLNVASLAVLE